MTNCISDYKLDCIYSYIDYCLSAGHYGLVQSILVYIFTNIESYSLDEILGYLTVTLPAKKHLEIRPALFKMAKQIYENSKQEGLFDGLE